MVSVPTSKPRPILLTRKVCDQLRKEWTIRSADIFARDGTHPRLPSGGHNVAGNLALQAAIESIFVNYMTLFAEQEKEWRIADPRQADYHSATYVKTDPAFQARIRNFTISSHRRLTEIMQDQREAYNLLGSVIGCCDATFSAVFPEHIQQARVPLNSIEIPPKSQKGFSR